MEMELRCRKEVVEGDKKEDVLHRVLYPQVHVNGVKKKKNLCTREDFNSWHLQDQISPEPV